MEIHPHLQPFIPKDSPISFAVKLSRKGQPQAFEIEFLNRDTITASNLGGEPVPGDHPQDLPGLVADGKRFTGFIRNYSPAKGFGFLGGEETDHFFNKDVFVHSRELVQALRDQTPNPPVGTWMTFVCQYNRKGQPQAKQIQLAPGQVVHGSNSCALVAANAALELLSVNSGNPGWTNPAATGSYSKVKEGIATFQAQVSTDAGDGTRQRSRQRSVRRDKKRKRDRWGSKSRSRSLRPPKATEEDFLANLAQKYRAGEGGEKRDSNKWDDEKWDDEKWDDKKWDDNKWNDDDAAGNDSEFLGD